MNITRYTVTSTGLQPASEGEVVLWSDHQEKVAWLLRLKGYVQQKVDSTYRAYLRVCAETGRHP